MSSSSRSFRASFSSPTWSLRSSRQGAVRCRTPSASKSTARGGVTICTTLSGAIAGCADHALQQPHGVEGGPHLDVVVAVDVDVLTLGHPAAHPGRPRVQGLVVVPA